MKQYKVELSFVHSRKTLVEAESAEQAVRMAAENIKQFYENGENMQDVVSIYIETSEKMSDGSTREAQTFLSKSDNFKCDSMEVRTRDAEEVADFVYGCIGDCKMCLHQDECEERD